MPSFNTRPIDQKPDVLSEKSQFTSHAMTAETSSAASCSSILSISPPLFVLLFHNNSFVVLVDCDKSFQVLVTQEVRV